MDSYKETGISPKEAAELIGCSADTIKELARCKSIPFYKVGAHYRFTRTALLNWISEQETNNYCKKGV